MIEVLLVKGAWDVKGTMNIMNTKNTWDVKGAMNIMNTKNAKNPWDTMNTFFKVITNASNSHFINAKCIMNAL